MSRGAAVAAVLLAAVWSCRVPFDLCDSAPADLGIATTDSLRVGQTIVLQARYAAGLFPACASTWTSENPGVLSVNASSAATTTATGIAPGTAIVKLLIGTASARATVTVTP